jgi:hypothetical protein
MCWILKLSVSSRVCVHRSRPLLCGSKGRSTDAMASHSQLSDCQEGQDPGSDGRSDDLNFADTIVVFANNLQGSSASFSEVRIITGRLTQLKHRRCRDRVTKSEAIDPAMPEGNPYKDLFSQVTRYVAVDLPANPSSFGDTLWRVHLQLLSMGKEKPRQ